MTTRAKMRCDSVESREDSSWDYEVNASRKTTVWDARFSAVCDGTEENKAFFKSTPGGQITLSTMRSDHFKAGTTYYIDFIEAPK